MSKKQQRIQIILISIGLLLILVTYFYYPYLKKVELTEDQILQKDLEKTADDDKITFFESVEHNGFYDLNKPFRIKSEKAYILNNEPNIVYMTNMHVILDLSDGRIINIVSDKGIYNKETYDCFFEDNVKASDGETNIFAKNLDLLAADNVLKIYNNVSLNYPTGTLQADKIDYNFETKFFKVSMFDDNAVKVKVIK